MGNLKEYVSPLHQSTTRDCLARMVDNKVKCMTVSKRYDKHYWDGDRKYGYGGYRYIADRWKPVAESLIKDYNLVKGSRILDVGCGKGFLLYEMLRIEPGLEIIGIDKSEYAIENSHKEVKKFLKSGLAQNLSEFDNESFDLLISLGTLHNLKIFDLEIALKQINRISKQSYIMVESYRNNQELFNLQCWALTAETFFDTSEWKWFFDKCDYDGDYEFIFF